MSLAAAAAVVASGLIVGGSSFSLAFAEPEKSSTGDGPAAGPGGTSDMSPGQPSGTPSDAATRGSTDPDSGSKAGTPGGAQRPESHVGNGRTGLESGTPGSETDKTPSSKQPEPTKSSVPQTSAPTPGELSPTPVDEAETPTPTEDEQPEDPSPGGSDTGGGTTQGTGARESAASPTGTEAAEGGETTPPVVTEPEAPKDDEEGVPPVVTDPASTKEGEEGEEEPQQPDWCWWPFPTFPTLPTGGGGGGAIPQTTTPIGDLLKIPQMQIPQLTTQLQTQLDQLQQLQIPLLPPDLMTQLTQPIQPFIDAVSGLATAASELPFTTVTLPVIVVPGGGSGTAGGGGGGGGGGGAGNAGVPGLGPRPGMPESPRITDKPGGKPASPPAPAENTQNAPVFAAGSGAAPAPAYRAGYTDYLRAAGLGEVAAVAVPGVTGILALVGAGGLLGYRQARAGHTVRASGTGRFMS